MNKHGLDVLFSYLFITGYLTEDSAPHRYKFPNNEIKHEMGLQILSYYDTIYSSDQHIIHNLSDILQNLIDRTQSFDDENDKLSFVKKSFISQFQPKFQELINGCGLANEKDSEEGIFANEDAVHSILNYIGMQAVNRWFGTEIYTDKLYSKGKGRVDFAMKNKHTGIIIEVKYNGNAPEALAQAKTYEKLISDQQDKIFIGFNISESKEVSLAGEIHIGGRCMPFP